jgi:hypothetical protein
LEAPLEKKCSMNIVQLFNKPYNITGKTKLGKKAIKMAYFLRIFDWLYGCFYLTRLVNPIDFKITFLDVLSLHIFQMGFFSEG